MKSRCPGEELLHHSDRGSQYCSGRYQQVLQDHGITCSMSRKGNCWEATEVAERIARIQSEGGSRKAESFFATLKKELVHHERYATREDAKQSIFEYIEVFYNRERLHSSLGYLSPEEFEKRGARA